MPTRSTYPGNASPGDVYTAANHERMPGGWLAYSRDENAHGSSEHFNEVTVSLPTARVLMIQAQVTTEGSASGQCRINHNGSLIMRAHADEEGNQSQERVIPAMYVGEFSAGEHTFDMDSFGADEDPDVQGPIPHILVVIDLGPAPSS